MQLDFTIVSLPGNAINLTNYISIDPMRVYFTAANWSTEVVLLVNGESEFPACLAIKSISQCRMLVKLMPLREARRSTCALVVLHLSSPACFRCEFYSGLLSSQRPPLVYLLIDCKMLHAFSLLNRPAHESHCVQS